MLYGATVPAHGVARLMPRRYNRDKPKTTGTFVMQKLGLVSVLLAGAVGMSAALPPAGTGRSPSQASSFHLLSARADEPFARSITLADAGAAANQASAGPPARAKCKEAVVSPVTGHADCVRPRGAAVDPPPRSAVPCARDVPGAEKRGCPEKAP
jgi:hypothetical protein